MKSLRLVRVFPLLFAGFLAACGGGGSGAGGALPSAPGTGEPTPMPSVTQAPGVKPPTGPSTPAPLPSAPPGGTAITHVLTAAVLYGYGGTPATTSLASAQPYVSWVQTSPSYAAAIRAAGIKVDAYKNFWRNYSSDNPSIGYNDLKPGGAHAAAEATDCSGAPLFDSTYGGGYETDARSSAAIAHAQLVAWYNLGTDYDAVFSDDTGALGGIPLPCGYSQSSYAAATNTVTESLRVPVFVNALGAGNYPDDQIGYAQASNVIGAMCEICYAGSSSSRGGDYAIGGSVWQHTENAEIAMVAMHKIFWDYARATGDPAAEIGLRTFVYASFLLTYDPSYAMLQEAFKTGSGFPIMPETGLVALNPTSSVTSVAGYLRAGVYMRDFGSCYYRGTSIGACAAVVNPGTSTAAIPANAYTHAMTLSGSGVLDGGSASFSAPAVTSLGPNGGVILVQ